MRGKSFSLMDYSDRDDLETLLYTSTICNSPGKMFTFEVFRETFSNKKVVREMVLALERELSVLAQFQKKEARKDYVDSEKDPECIKDIVSTLIMYGLDAQYALNEMELCDLPIYIKAHEKIRKEEMESNRLWTFFTMMPHIDAKKMKNGAKDLIIFPWEEEEAKIEAERTINEGMERFENFMNTKKSDYYGK